MKTLLIPILLAALLAGCAPTPRRKMLVDLNGTRPDTLVLMSIGLRGHATAIDTFALRSDGVFAFDIDTLPCGYYRLWGGPAVHCDLVVEPTDSSMKVCGTGRNPVRWTVSGSRSTAAMWQAERARRSAEQAFESERSRLLRPDASRASLDSLYATLRASARAVRRLTDSLLASEASHAAAMPMLLARVGNCPVYDPVADIRLLERGAAQMRQALPGCVLACGFAADVDSLSCVVAVNSLFAAGRHLPPIAGMPPDTDPAKPLTIVIDRIIRPGDPLVERAMARRFVSSVCLLATDSIVDKLHLDLRTNVSTGICRLPVLPQLPIYLEVSPTDTIVRSIMGPDIVEAARR